MTGRAGLLVPVWVCLILAAATQRVDAAPASPVVFEVSHRTDATGVDISGWIVGKGVELDLLIDEVIVYQGGPSEPRPEVTARYPGVEGAEWPGFSIRLGLDQLGRGRHRVRILARDHAAGTHVLMDATFLVPPVPGRPLAAREIGGIVLALTILTAAGAAIARLPERTSTVDRLPGWLALTVLVGSAAIVVAPKLSSSFMAPTPGLFAPLSNWDGNWYVAIAAKGYDRIRAFVFFPLYPAFLRIIGLIPLPLQLTGALVNVGLVAAATRVARADQPGRDVALAFLFLCPYACFLSALYTEALFLFLGLSLLFCLRRNNVMATFVVSALAALTRPTGFLFSLLSLGHGATRRRAAASGMAGSVAGLAGWCLWLAHRTGDPLVFRNAQVWFGRSRHFSLGRLLDNTASALAAHQTDAVGGLLMLAVIAVGAIGLAFERRPAEALFSLLVVCAGLSTNSLTSTTRYALGAFPAILYLGSKLRPGKAAWVTLGALALLKTFLAYQFGRGAFIG